MRTFIEVRIWTTALLLLVAIILLLTYRKTKGKGFLLAYAILLFIPNVFACVQNALARTATSNGTLARILGSTETISVVLMSVSLAATGCFLAYIVAMKPSAQPDAGDEPPPRDSAR